MMLKLMSRRWPSKGEFAASLAVPRTHLHTLFHARVHSQTVSRFYTLKSQIFTLLHAHYTHPLSLKHTFTYTPSLPLIQIGFHSITAQQLQSLKHPRPRTLIFPHSCTSSPQSPFHLLILTSHRQPQRCQISYSVSLICRFHPPKNSLLHPNVCLHIELSLEGLITAVSW